MKPVRLPASATLALPRWGLLLLAFVYILPGLLGRDPLQSDEAASFGIMWTMAHGNLHDWLSPNIVGLAMPEEGPLSFWLTATLIKLLGGTMGDVMAARLATISFFAIGATSIWFATYRLGRSPEAQPMQLAFGGQPEPKDYGRVLADGALLIYIGCIGLLQHSHETKAEALLVSLVALFIYVAIRYIETPGLLNGLFIGTTLGCMVLTRGWPVPLTLYLSLLACSFLLRLKVRPLLLHLSVALIAAVAITLLWPFCITLSPSVDNVPFTAWLTWNQAQVGWPNLDAARFFLKNGLLFFWPAWPFAIWATYAWRRQWHNRHIALPFCLIGALGFLALTSPSTHEASLLPLLPPLAILAAFGLPTMKRGAINAVDWFSVMALSACAAFIWMGWLAKQTGWPTWLARNVQKLTPGYIPELNLIALFAALCATAAWLLIVYWRLSRHPRVLWRAVVLSASGVILCWTLLATLWLPWINYGKSYAGVAQQISSRLPSRDSCINAYIRPASRASLAHLGKLHFSQPDSMKCDYLLIQDQLNRSKQKNDPIVLPDGSGKWQLIWRGRRPNERDERFHLFQRKN